MGQKLLLTWDCISNIGTDRVKERVQKFAKLSQSSNELGWSLVLYFDFPTTHPTHQNEIVRITPFRKLKFGMLAKLDQTRKNRAEYCIIARYG